MYYSKWGERWCEDGHTLIVYDRDLKMCGQTIQQFLKNRKTTQMIPQSIHDELDAEREYQLSKGRKDKLEGEDGWSYDFDDANTIADWGAYITDYLGRAINVGSNFSESRKNLVKVATLACAALEAWDRNKGFPPRHFDKVMVFPPKGSGVPDHIEER